MWEIHPGDFVVHQMSGSRLESLKQLLFCDIAAASQVDHPKGIIEIEVEASRDKFELAIFHILLQVQLLGQRLL